MFIYFADIAGNLNNFAVVCLIITAVSLCFLIPIFGHVVAELTEDHKDRKIITKITKIVAWVAVLCSTIIVFVPNTKTIYLLAGAQMAENIAKSPKFDETTNKLYEVLNNKLDQIIKDELPKQKESK